MGSAGLIDGFISSQVTGRGLDERTGKAYRLDLEHFCRWLEKNEEFQDSGAAMEASSEVSSESATEMFSEYERNGAEKVLASDDRAAWRRKIEQYLIYLSKEKKLRSSTISRKYRVFGYFLTYLVKQGTISDAGILEDICLRTMHFESDASEYQVQKLSGNGPLSKQEVDIFFQAIRQEQEKLDSAFRRRLCLRDQIMMGLLFYHGIEISELLKMEIFDYDRKSGNLTIRRKRESGCTVRLFSRELREQMEKWLDVHEYFERDQEFRDKMFLSKLGRPLSMKMVILIFEKYRLLAGIEKECTPRDLKRSMKRYASELMEEWCN